MRGCYRKASTSSTELQDNLVASVAQERDNIAQTGPVKILGQAEAFIDLVFEGSQLLRRNANGGSGSVLERRHFGSLTPPFALLLQQTLGVGQIGLHLARYVRVSGMILKPLFI